MEFSFSFFGNYVEEGGVNFVLQGLRLSSKTTHVQKHMAACFNLPVQADSYIALPVQGQSLISYHSCFVMFETLYLTDPCHSSQWWGKERTLNFISIRTLSCWSFVVDQTTSWCQCCLSYTGFCMVCKTWDGHGNLECYECSGRPAVVCTLDVIETVWELVCSDRWMTPGILKGDLEIYREAKFIWDCARYQDELADWPSFVTLKIDRLSLFYLPARKY
jgi:hypothetical protein